MNSERQRGYLHIVIFYNFVVFTRASYFIFRNSSYLYKIYINFLIFYIQLYCFILYYFPIFIL